MPNLCAGVEEITCEAVVKNSDVIAKPIPGGIVASLSPPDRRAHYPGMEGSSLVSDSVAVLHFPLELAQWKSADNLSQGKLQHRKL